MRVIAGSAKRLLLKTVEGMETRPTTDRIKETLFNMISLYLADSIFLDLFAGSGAIGIEALSRGAKKAVFVEQSSKAVECIQDNLKTTGLSAKAEVRKMDVISALNRMKNTESYDYIFMDPPYNLSLERMALQRISELQLLNPDGIIIVEASLETEFDYVDELGLSIIKEKCYKTNKHVFIELKEEHYA